MLAETKEDISEKSEKDIGNNRLRVVVTGEFNSGKSSLVNLLLRRTVLPSSAKYSAMPTQIVTLSQSETWSVEGRDNRVIDPADFRDGRIPGDMVENVRIGLPDNELGDIEIFEVPIDPYGHLSSKAKEDIRKADLLIWCTMGQRAWTLGEIDIVKVLPRNLYRHAILAVTRVDNLRDDKSRDLVFERVSDLARPYFRKVVMVNASPSAISSSNSDSSWKKAGGEGLHAAVARAIDELRNEERKTGNVVPLKLSKGISGTEDRVSARLQSADALAEFWRGRVNKFTAFVGNSEIDFDADSVCDLIDIMVRDLGSAVADASVSDAERTALKHLVENVFGTVQHLSLQEKPDAALGMLDLVLQLERELSFIASYGAGGQDLWPADEPEQFHRHPLELTPTGV